MNITNKDQPHLTAIIIAAEKYSEHLRSSMRFSSDPDHIEKCYRESREIDEHLFEFKKVYWRHDPLNEPKRESPVAIFKE